MSDTNTTIDPTKEYSPEQMAAMRQILAVEDARRAEELAAKRAAYAKRLAEVMGTDSAKAFRADLAAFVQAVEADDDKSFHVEALRMALGRIEA